MSTAPGREVAQRKIPLLSKSGRVVAHALVDDADYETLAAHRWFLGHHGYAARWHGGRGGHQLLMHREILGLSYKDGLEADHVNRERLDNRRTNLRVVTHATNGQNVGTKNVPGRTSRFRGVRRASKNRWTAYATVAGRFLYLGIYANEEEAASVAADFRRERMPFAVEVAA